MQTRQQQDATLALKHVKEILQKIENGKNEELRKSYVTATHRFPFLVRQNGLQQTLGFYAGKANAKENADNAEAIFYRHICEVLEPEKGEDPAEKLLGVSLEDYMRYSRRCLEAALWYRRFAASLLDDEKITKGKEGGKMTSITMKRKKLPPTGWDNPGLFFDKGFQEWKIDSGKRGEDIASHIKAVCDIPVSQIYRDAYRRWIRETSNKASFAGWFGQLDGTRLFIGLGMAHVLETQVCRHPVYGIPYIPGSALKGLARAKAKKYADKGEYGMNQGVVNILFGPDCNDPKNPDIEADTGYLIFHDAWWIPKGEEGGSEDKPYVPEIVTVHAVEYYKNQGKKDAPHPDMESPNPNQQLAVQGSFYFVVEGVPQWAELGRKFLTLALEADGIGGKVAAGYGYFVEEAAQKKKREALEEVERERVATQKAEEEAQRAAEDKKRQEKIAAEEKTKWLASLTLEKLLIHELNTLLDQHDNLSNKLGTAAKEIQSGIQGQVNRILKHNEWHLAGNTDKREALESIERSFPLLLKKNRKKKLDNAKRLLAAEDDE